MGVEPHAPAGVFGTRPPHLDHRCPQYGFCCGRGDRQKIKTRFLARQDRTSRTRSEHRLSSRSRLEAPSQTFYFEGGLASLVNFNNRLLKPVHKNIFYIEKAAEGVESVEVALQYVDESRPASSDSPTISTTPKAARTSPASRPPSPARSTPMQKRTIWPKTARTISPATTSLEGLTAVVSVKLREIQFEGQTKAKLGSVEAQSAVATVFGEAFSAIPRGESGRRPRHHRQDHPGHEGPQGRQGRKGFASCARAPSKA